MEPSSRVGTVLDGRYRIERLLGQGGMGMVYRAHHLAMDRPVAVKVLRGNLARDPVAARRFALEAKTTTKVDSPNAVKVFDFGITSDGEYFMVMEYLDGRTAQRELDVDGPMEMRRALHVIRQALAGLAAAHAVGVIHRDVKPENLLLMRQGNDPDACKVLDFGVAKLMVQAADPGTALTREGMVFGTPEFMSPEQACGQPLDGRSDLYSLAATLYTLLTGEPLFRGSAAVEILSKHVTTPPPRLVQRPGLEHLHALDQVLQRALAKKPDDRFRDAAELERALAFLAPASEPQSLAGSPTVSTPALAAQSAAESPLGLFNLAEELEAEWAAEEGKRPTGAAPLHSGEFRPGVTGYLPKVTPSLELAASASAMSAQVAVPQRAAPPSALGPLAPPPPPPLMSTMSTMSTHAMVQAVAPRRRWLWLVALFGFGAAAAVVPVALSALRSPGRETAGPKVATAATAEAEVDAASIKVAAEPATARGSDRGAGSETETGPGTESETGSGTTDSASGTGSASGAGSASASASGPAAGSGASGTGSAPETASAPETGAAAGSASGSASGSGSTSTSGTASAPGTEPATGSGASPATAPAHPKPGPKPIDKRKLREHLDAARAARAAGKHLAQLTQADLALEVSPRDANALFLRADALLGSGDNVNGCKEMKRLRSAAATARAEAAGCK